MKKNNNKKIIQTLVVLSSASLLAACATPPMYNAAKGNISDVKDSITQNDAKYTQQAKAANQAVIIKNGMYVDSTPIDIAQTPAWLKNHITIHGGILPFSFYSQNVVRNSNVSVSYQEGLQANKTFSLDYSGTVEGALKAISDKTGYIYKINGNQIYWQQYVTKTFDIAFLPGASSYLVGKKSGGSGDSTNSSSGSGDAVVTQGNKGASENEYSNIQAQISVWNDLESTIKSMLSNNGKVIVSQSTTSITVHDTPDRVKAIGNYIKQVNNNLSQQVMIKVEVLDIDLHKDFNYGINWALAARFAESKSFIFNGNFSQPVSISPLSGGASAIGAGISSGGSNPSEVLINALSQQGDVSVATEPTIVTTNDQVASINLVSQVGYLAKISNTSSSDQQQGGQTQTTITPGQVSTGLTLYILPKIIDGKVYMQLSSDLSNLKEIRDLYSEGSDSDPTKDAQKIQVPDITSKEFNQRSIVKSGTTLILAGFKQMSNQTAGSKMFGISALGGKGAQQEDQETIVLVTPYILNQNQQEQD